MLFFSKGNFFFLYPTVPFYDIMNSPRVPQTKWKQEFHGDFRGSCNSIFIFQCKIEGTAKQCPPNNARCITISPLALDIYLRPWMVSKIANKGWLAILMHLEKWFWACQQRFSRSWTYVYTTKSRDHLINSAAPLYNHTITRWNPDPLHIFQPMLTKVAVQLYIQLHCKYIQCNFYSF